MLPTRPMPTNAPRRRTSATIMQLRRDQRSAAAPKSGPKSIAGSRSASSTSVIAHGECQRSKAIRSRAT